MERPMDLESQNMEERLIALERKVKVQDFWIAVLAAAILIRYVV